MAHNLPLITLSGPPASGTSTLGRMLADEFDFEILNGGDIFREMAADRGISLSEFTESAEGDPSIDKVLDGRLEDEIDAHVEGCRKPDGEGLIVESRLAGWHADGRADLTVWLDAPIEVRANRLSERRETPRQLREREKSDANRYLEYYGIDVRDLSIYDLVVNTAALSEDGMLQTVRVAIEDVRTEDG